MLGLQTRHNVTANQVRELVKGYINNDEEGVYEYILSGENEDMACKLSK